MARKAALKVFRTPIGFHDAYVAAPSRKAALEAWGADKDLFASGSAELVTDPALTAEPLATPGEVIKRSRGSLADHLKAAGPGKPKAKAKPETQEEGRRAASRKRVRLPKPRPSRGKLDQAEAAVAAFETRASAERAELDRREAELLKERQALNARHRRAADKLETQRERARARYEREMERWRAET